MTDADLVKVESDGAIRILTLNRPEARNSFDDPLKLAFIDALRSIERDPDARAIVLTGAGKAFSAGGDISNFENRREFANRFYWMRIARAVPEALMRCHLPVVTAVNGPAVGLGCSLALLSDFVVVADTAFLADPHVNAGLVAGDGGAVLWPLLVGYLKAKEFLLLGERIPAAEAVRLGLANRMVSADEVVPEALGVARRLAELSPHAVQETKRAINLHLEDAALRITPFALAAESESFATDEVKDFVAKFAAEKR